MRNTLSHRNDNYLNLDLNMHKLYFNSIMQCFLAMWASLPQCVQAKGFPFPHDIPHAETFFEFLLRTPKTITHYS